MAEAAAKLIVNMYDHQGCSCTPNGKHTDPPTELNWRTGLKHSQHFRSQIISSSARIVSSRLSHLLAFFSASRDEHQAKDQRLDTDEQMKTGLAPWVAFRRMTTGSVGWQTVLFFSCHGKQVFGQTQLKWKWKQKNWRFWSTHYSKYLHYIL